MSHYDDVEEEEKDKGGRPSKSIDYAKLSKMCAIHCTGEECSSILDMDYDTLNRNLIADGHGGFADYFKKHSATGKMSLRRKQFTKAVDEGSVPMLIWLGKQYLGQKDKEEVMHEEKDHNIVINLVDAVKPDESI